MHEYVEEMMRERVFTEITETWRMRHGEDGDVGEDPVLLLADVTDEMLGTHPSTTHELELTWMSSV